GVPRFVKSFMYMIESDRIIKVNTQSAELTIAEDGTGKLPSEIEFKMEDVVDWDEGVDAFVEEILEKNKDYTVMFVAGGEHLPRSKRFEKAISGCIAAHYLWRMGNRKG
ncbi:hypothetical protein KY312_01840, partial [Candidatus Woesearchaeota archaeon]|nr:hypothetical protein [Candidatus Woesearchaeota archaeon]